MAHKGPFPLKDGEKPVLRTSRIALNASKAQPWVTATTAGGAMGRALSPAKKSEVPQNGLEVRASRDNIAEPYPGVPLPSRGPVDIPFGGGQSTRPRRELGRIRAGPTGPPRRSPTSRGSPHRGARPHPDRPACRGYVRRGRHRGALPG